MYAGSALTCTANGEAPWRLYALDLPESQRNSRFCAKGRSNRPISGVSSSLGTRVGCIEPLASSEAGEPTKVAKHRCGPTVHTCRFVKMSPASRHDGQPHKTTQ
eukprot:2698746-Amphidinium_carterae.4